MPRSTQIVPQNTQTGLPAAPDYLQDVETEGLDKLKDHVRPERLKIVQKQSDTKLVENFGIGSVVLIPSLVPVCDRDGNFLFTPLFYYNEFVLWNPIEMQDSLPAVRDRSFDETSDIARRARNANTREEACPENPEFIIRYQEHLNFICHIPVFDVIGVMSFSRAEFTKGEAFCSKIYSRKKAIWVNVFQAQLSERPPRKGGTWYGFDISNPDGGSSPWIAQELVESYRELHTNFTEAHANSLILTDYEDDLSNLDGDSAGEVGPADTI